MGSWNKTCGLSNLPILSGEPVYVFILEKGDKDDHCYSTHLYAPALLTFESIYNDYGGGENSSGIGLDILMSSIKENLVEMPLGKNKYHDIAVTKAEFNEKLFFDAVGNSRLQINHYNGPRDIEFTMFRKDFVDIIFDTYVIEEYVGENNGNFGYRNSYTNYKFADLVAEIPKIITALKAKYDSDYDMMRFFSEIRIPTDIDNYRRINGWFSRHETYRYSSLSQIYKNLADMLENNQDTQAEDLLTQYLKAKFIDNFMCVTRKSWIPQSGEGSQQQDPTGYRVLISAMDQVLKSKFENNFDEDYSE